MDHDRVVVELPLLAAMRRTIAGCATLVLVIVAASACGSVDQPEATVTVTSPARETVTTRSSSPVVIHGLPSRPTVAESSAAALNPVRIASTFGPARVYSVRGGGGDIPIEPGTWTATAAAPDPNVLTPCTAKQWNGSDESDLVVVWGTPIGEPTFNFPIRDVEGSIQLTGQCDWRWVGP